MPNMGKEIRTASLRPQCCTPRPIGSNIIGTRSLRGDASGPGVAWVSRKERQSPHLVAAAVHSGSPPGEFATGHDDISLLVGKTASEGAEVAELPAIGLSQALESVGALWRRAEASETTPEQAAETLGYRGLGLQARRRLSALRAYGLIDGGQSVRLSDLALTIMHLGLQGQQSSGDYLSAVRTAALRPKLFREVFRSCGNAPYDALRWHLTNDLGLSSTAARTFIAAFRDALAAGRLKEAESPGLEGSPPADAGDLRGETSHVFRWLLSSNATAELRLFGENVEAADLERLHQYVELARLALGGLERKAKPSQRSKVARRPLPHRKAGPRRHRR